MTYQVSFRPVKKNTSADADQTILECAQHTGLELISVCGGTGTCGKCKVKIVKGSVSDITEKERAGLTSDELKKGFRLACQVTPLSDLEVSVLAESMATPLRAQVEGTAVPVIPDLKIGQLDPGAPLQLGLAVDLGTTKIACYLVNLMDGHILSSVGTMNPLVSYGDDLIARIDKARSAETARTMQALLVQSINQNIDTLCAQTDTAFQEVVKMVLVANTAMHHLFSGVCVDSLLAVPYTPAVTEPMDISAESMGLNMADGAVIHLLPNIAGYVGADHVAMILSTEIAISDKTIIALDVGTNTEVCLVHHKNMVSASCASGPAFEGGCTRHGMKASNGAIDHVGIMNGDIIYHTIGNEKPKGICGSGMLDLLACLRELDIIDAGGRFKDNKKVRMRDNTREFIISDRKESALDEAVTITQKDIRALQLAKGAIQAGIEILLKNQKCTLSQIDQVVVAGAFGSYIDISSAIAVGMLPPLPSDKFTQVGNAAGMGAVMALVSEKKRTEATSIANRVKYVELGGTQAFMDTFVDAMKIERQEPPFT